MVLIFDMLPLQSHAIVPRTIRCRAVKRARATMTAGLGEGGRRARVELESREERQREDKVLGGGRRGLLQLRRAPEARQRAVDRVERETLRSEVAGEGPALLGGILRD